MPENENENLKYVWLDLETTGTNAQENIILEVGIVVTNASLDELARGSWVLGDDGILAEADEFVREMHAASGLDKLVADGVSIYEAEARVIALLEPLGKKGDFVLAGSGVSHFDRRFLEEEMPQLLEWFRYYSIDVGILRRVLRMIGREDLLLKGSDDKTHRALDDALLHLEELRHIKKALT